MFKKNWEIEISPNCLPELIELNSLKGAVPSSARDRLYEINSLQEAWVILDRIYGQHFDLRNKLKQELFAISISAKVSPHIEIEIYEKVYRLAAKILAVSPQILA